MKGAWGYYAAFGIALVLLVVSEIAAPRPVDWRESYTGFDHIPYGALVVREQLESLSGDVIESEKTITELVWEGNAEPGTNYLVINDIFDPDESDLENLLEFVDQGGTAFVSAEYFGGLLSDTLHFGTATIWSAANSSRDFSARLARMLWRDTIVLGFQNPGLQHRRDSIRVGQAYAYFDSFDTAQSVIIATDDVERPVFIRVDRGSGRIFLHSIPLAFTNLNVLSSGGARHAFAALSYLPEKKTIWDEYYKVGRQYRTSFLRAIVADDSLRYAWWLLLAGVALFVFVYARRRQRAIPIVDPPANTTVEFVTMIGRLYYERGAHVSIAERKIAYFLEYLRSRIGVHTDRRDEAFVQRVAERTGVAATRIGAIFARITLLERRGVVEDDDLLGLERDLHDFYSNSKR